MKYTTLGQTNIKVSKVCLGCMSFGKAGTMHDWTLDEKQTEEMVKHALDLGINFFDTANTYSNGTSEEYSGQSRFLPDSIAVCIVLLLCIPIPEVCFRVDDYQIRYQ